MQRFIILDRCIHFQALDAIDKVGDIAHVKYEKIDNAPLEVIEY